MRLLSFLKERWLLGLALLLASLLKIWLLVQNVVPFNSDEAIIALMARHILAGERPIFFYGQAYMGSLDAWFVAAGFAVFGEHVWVIRIVQLLLYLIVIMTTAALGEKIFGSSRVGDLAALFMAIPTVNFTLYTTVALGCYVEALLIGNLLLILSINMVSQIHAGEQLNFWSCLIWGFLAGIGFWSIASTLIYSITAGLYILWGLRSYQTQRSLWEKLRASGIAFIIGGLLGVAPMLIYAWQHGIEPFIIAQVGIDLARIDQPAWFIQIWQHLIGFVLLGLSVILGLRPPWDIRLLALPLMPFALMFWMGVVIFGVRFLKCRAGQFSRQFLLLGVVILFLLVFVLSPYGADPSGRYFLPLVVPLSIFAAGFVFYMKTRVGSWYWGLAGLLLLFHVWGIIQSANQYPPGITTQIGPPTQTDHRFDQALMDFLEDKGLTRGYTTYWLAYPLAFLSQEQLIFIPRLPYHLDLYYDERQDRYPAYDRVVAEADRVAYITSYHPQLDTFLTNAFLDQAIVWDEIRIGGYHVFYNLSRTVRPEDIGLGQTIRQ